MEGTVKDAVEVADPVESLHDGYDDCTKWASKGGCERNKRWMDVNCARSCAERSRAAEHADASPHAGRASSDNSTHDDDAATGESTAASVESAASSVASSAEAIASQVEDSNLPSAPVIVDLGSDAAAESSVQEPPSERHNGQAMQQEREPSHGGNEMVQERELSLEQEMLQTSETAEKAETLQEPGSQQQQAVHHQEVVHEREPSPEQKVLQASENPQKPETLREPELQQQQQALQQERESLESRDALQEMETPIPQTEQPQIQRELHTEQLQPPSSLESNPEPRLRQAEGLRQQLGAHEARQPQQQTQEDEVPSPPEPKEPSPPASRGQPEEPSLLQAAQSAAAAAAARSRGEDWPSGTDARVNNALADTPRPGVAKPGPPGAFVGQEMATVEPIPEHVNSNAEQATATPREAAATEGLGRPPTAQEDEVAHIMQRGEDDTLLSPGDVATDASVAIETGGSPDAVRDSSTAPSRQGDDGTAQEEDSGAEVSRQLAENLQEGHADVLAPSAKQAGAWEEADTEALSLGVEPGLNGADSTAGLPPAPASTLAHGSPDPSATSLELLSPSSLGVPSASTDADNTPSGLNSVELRHEPGLNGAQLEANEMDGAAPLSDTVRTVLDSNEKLKVAPSVGRQDEAVINADQSTGAPSDGAAVEDLPPSTEERGENIDQQAASSAENAARQTVVEQTLSRAREIVEERRRAALEGGNTAAGSMGTGMRDPLRAPQAQSPEGDNRSVAGVSEVQAQQRHAAPGTEGLTHTLSEETERWSTSQHVSADALEEPLHHVDEPPRTTAPSSGADGGRRDAPADETTQRVDDRTPPEGNTIERRDQPDERRDSADEPQAGPQGSAAAQRQRGIGDEYVADSAKAGFADDTEGSHDHDDGLNGDSHGEDENEEHEEHDDANDQEDGSRGSPDYDNDDRDDDDTDIVARKARMERQARLADFDEDEDDDGENDDDDDEDEDDDNGDSDGDHDEAPNARMERHDLTDDHDDVDSRSREQQGDTPSEGDGNDNEQEGSEESSSSSQSQEGIVSHKDVELKNHQQLLQERIEQRRRETLLRAQAHK
jgi:hypothetical protein